MSFLTSPVMSFLYPPPLTDLLASTPAEKTCSADFTRPPAAFPPTPQLRKEGRKEGAVAAFLPLLPHPAQRCDIFSTNAFWDKRELGRRNRQRYLFSTVIPAATSV